MSGDMSLSVNGQARVPPGFRFHPTEEELLHYYLRKKVAYQKIDLDVIRDIDLNKLEPWDLQEKCKIGSTPQNDWYFFSHKDKKYPTGTRTNRATAAGFWKATGRDKVIHTNFKRIGMRKTLVFYKGRAPHGQKSDWIMHEYRLEEHSHDSTAQSNVAANSEGTAEASQEDGWVVCRVFKKKNHVKTNDSPNNSSITIDMTNQMHLNSSSSDGALDHILQYMGRACKQETDHNRHNLQRSLRPVDSGNTHERFMQLPPLESPSNLQSPLPGPDHPSTQHQSCYTPDVIPIVADADVSTNSNSNNYNNMNPVLFHVEPGLNDWATMDRLVASQLNVQADSSSLPFYSDPDTYQLRSTNSLCAGLQDYGNHGGEVDLWAFARSTSSDTLSHQMSSPLSEEFDYQR